MRRRSSTASGSLRAAAPPRRRPASPARAASTDADCTQRTGLVGTWFAVETAFGRSRIQQYGPALDAVLTAKKARLRRAAAVVATG